MPRTKDEDSSFGRRRRWHNRHQITSSKGNDGLPKSRRAYFDNAAAVHVKRGEFSDVLLYQPWDSDDNGGYETRLRRRFIQFPQFLSPRNKLLPIWAGGAKGVGSPGQPLVAPAASPFTVLRATSPSSKSAASPEVWLQSRGNALPKPPPVRAASIADESGSTTSESGSAIAANQNDLPANVAANMQTEIEESGPPVARTQSRPRKSLALAKGHLNESVMAEASRETHFRDLIAWCDKKHLNLVSLWRRLDLDGNMTLHKREFVKGFLDLDYGGDIEQLWSNLDRDGTGIITFLEFAPDHALDLARFKYWAETKFGTLVKMFNAMDNDRNGKLTYEEFKKCCVQHELPDNLRGSLATLFLLVDDPEDKHGRGIITQSELTFLSVWKCPEYLFHKADHEAKAKFHAKLLKENNGNPLIAWRKCLDANGSMRVDYEEFIRGCRNLFRAGVAEAQPKQGVVALYCALDHNRSGWFTFREWDPSYHRLLYEFVTWVKSNFGKVSHWVRTCGGDDKAGININTFRKSIRPLSMDEEEVELLFEGLSMVPIKMGKHLEAGRMHPRDVYYLDNWDPQHEVEEDIAWENLAFQHDWIRKSAMLGKKLSPMHHNKKDRTSLPGDAAKAAAPAARSEASKLT